MLTLGNPLQALQEFCKFLSHVAWLASMHAHRWL